VSRERARPAPGRTSEFERLFRTCYPRVSGYAIRRTTDRAMAEEAVSETFLIAWRRMDSLPAEPLPWLLGVARKVVANQRRAAGRNSPAGPSVPLEAVPDRVREPEMAEVVADRAAFAASFAALSAGDREVLALVNWDGLSAREAATVLECTTANFYLRLHRARRRLLAHLASQGHSFGQHAVRPVPRRVADV
jgi:RNA polymerase sigma-70 factor, ECF subfamily